MNEPLKMVGVNEMQTTNWECWVALHCWYMLIPHVYIMGLVMETMTSFRVVPWLVDLWGASQLSQEDWLQTATRLRGQSLVFSWWERDEGKFPWCNHQPSMKRWENMGMVWFKILWISFAFFLFCFGPSIKSVALGTSMFSLWVQNPFNHCSFSICVVTWHLLLPSTKVGGWGEARCRVGFHTIGGVQWSCQGLKSSKHGVWSLKRVHDDHGLLSFIYLFSGNFTNNLFFPPQKIEDLELWPSIPKSFFFLRVCWAFRKRIPFSPTAATHRLTRLLVEERCLGSCPFKVWVHRSEGSMATKTCYIHVSYIYTNVYKYN